LTGSFIRDAGEYAADGQDSLSLTLSVILVTWRRAPFVERCLESLRTQERPVDDVVVVDASEGYGTRDVVQQFPGVKYVHFPGGAGHMTTARNEGLRHVRGDVIAFLDDDTRAHPQWSRRLLHRFADPDVDAVAGRTLNGIADEDRDGVDEIGRLYADGRLTGNFAADPGRVVEIDHGIGANMSFRREWLARLGGFRDIFPGTAMREDTDVFLRLGALGGRAVFDPAPSVDHLPAPHVRGQRFDLRYAFYGERNHVQLLAVNRGLASTSVRAYLKNFAAGLWRADAERRLASRVIRGAVRLAGALAGLFVSARCGAWRGLPHERQDETGTGIRRHLERQAD
jgi:GT2 family glycosyltransferase